MKLYILLSIIGLFISMSKTKRNCDASEAVKCGSDYKAALKKVGNNQHKFCLSVHGYLDCLDWNDCLTQDIKDKVKEVFQTIGIKCGDWNQLTKSGPVDFLKSSDKSKLRTSLHLM
ncbi:hypothetical protein LOTGIDRAFT_153267 [Lottia gigantea]|uniref:Uncharacterized protein n=1 Tax=Lottia gigantea TaxID=225164 RepID=V4AJP4_LOTGI|nr:hypothetical protein LOTGIDRAFT_153267 [Lottia gigantea]ESO93796.1 hypothetical protein LOTGIDRAFT_153267 [Lottia gigantea]